MKWNISEKSQERESVDLDARLARLAAVCSRRRAPWRLRERLLAEAELRAWPSQPRPRRISAWGLALAALTALLLLVALQPGLRSTIFPQSGRNPLPALLSSLIPSRVRPWIYPGSGASPPPPSQPDGLEALSTASYVALPYSDPSIANGTEITVRVTVPSSELLAWGIPAPEHGLDEEVPADLVLGDDGLPRAIRVLSTTSSAAEEIYP